MGVSNIPDPINALADHFRSSGLGSAGGHAVLCIPTSLQKSLDGMFSQSKGSLGKANFNPKEIKNLIGSVSEEDFGRWCLLDATAFIYIMRVLLGAEPCLAKDQGLFRLIEALETFGDGGNEFAMSQELLIDYKNTVGESLAVELLSYFIDIKESGFSRRWAGLLLVELLQESEANRKRLWGLPDSNFKDIGEIIVSGTDRMLKIVAGKVIWQMMQEFENEEEIRYRLPAFCQSSEADDFTKDFPLQHGSQWESGFAGFITEMELNRYDLDLGLPTGYTGIQVRLGNNNPISPDIGVISISIAEIFSIYIPPNRDHSPDWVDFKISNISEIEFTGTVVAEDSMNDLIYFKLHLCDYDKDGYLYLLSMRPSSDSDSVTILCYKSEIEAFAEDVERCRDKVLQQKGNRRPMSSAPMKDIQANPACYKSQQQKLDELERHREDILRVLESPARSNAYASSITDPDESTVDKNLPELKQREQRENPKGIEKEISGVGLVEAEIAKEADSANSGKEPSASIPVIQRRQTLTHHPSPSPSLVGVSDVAMERELIPSSTPLVPPAAEDRHMGASAIVLGSSSPPLRSSIQAQLQQVTGSSNDMPSRDSELSKITAVSDEEDLENIFRILKRGKAIKKPDTVKHQPTLVSKLWGEVPAAQESPKEQPEIPERIIPMVFGAPTTSVPKNPLVTDRKQEERPLPVIAHVAELSGGPLKNLLAVERHTESNFDITEWLSRPAVDNSRANPEENSRPPVLEELLSRDITVKETPITTRSKQKAKIKQKTFPNTENQEELRTPPNSYGTRSKTKEKGKFKGRISNKDGPSDKITNKVQTTVTKSTTVSKTRRRIMEPEKIELVSPEDTSIWELPESGRSETEMKISTKKGKGRSRAMLLKEAPALKAKLVEKRKPPPKKRVYGKKSMAKSDPKSSEFVLDSNEEIESVQEVKLPVHRPTSKQKQNSRPKRQVIHKFALTRDIAVQDSNDEVVEQANKLSARLPRSKMKPKPKPRTAPASALTKRTLAQDNEDEGMKQLEVEKYLPIRVSTPKSIPEPEPEPKQKEVFQSVSSKLTAAQDEDEKLSAIRLKSKTTWKTLPALVSAKRTTVHDNGDRPESRKEKESPAHIPKEKAVLRFAPASALTKRAVYQGTDGESSHSEDIGPPGKRKKLEQAKTARIMEASPLQAKKALVNLEKGPKLDSFLNTSEADDDSSWRPKTRLRAKVELAAKSVEMKRSLAGLEKAKTGKIQKATREGESSKEPSEKTKDIGYLPGGNRHKTIQRSPNLSSESSKLLAEGNVEGTFNGGIEHLENRTLEKQGEVTPEVPAGPRTPGSNFIHIEDVTISLAPGRNSPSDSKGTQAKTISHQSTLAQVDSARAGKRVMLYDNIKKQANEPHSPQVVTEIDVSHSGKEKYIVEISNARGHSKQKALLATDHRGPAKENPAPIAVMNPDVPSSHYVAGDPQNNPSDCSLNLVLFQKQDRDTIPFVAPREMVKAPRTPQAHSEVLIDDHLARKAQIISWDSQGPKNQGRTPATEIVHVGNFYGKDGFSVDDSGALPNTERAFSLFVLASDDEDRIITRRKEKLSPYTVRPLRRGTETVVDENGSPLLMPTYQHQSGPVEQLEIDESNSDSGEQVEGKNSADFVMIDVVDDLQQEVSVYSVEDSDGDTDLEMRDILNYEGQGPPAVDSEALDEKLTAAREVVLETRHEGHAHHKISIIEILDTDDSDNEQTEELVLQDFFKPSIIPHQKSDSGFTLGKNPMAENPQQVLRSSLATKENLPALRNTTILDEKRFLGFKSVSSESREISPVVKDVLSGVSMGENCTETGFSKWLQGSGLRKANNSNDDNRTAPQKLSKSFQSGDSDNTLVNGGNNGNSRVHRDLNRNPQEPKQRPEGQGQEEDKLDSCGDDSDFDTDDYEGSDTDEDEDGAFSGDENDGPAWWKSLPEYHRETLAVLDQISRGLLRYLMSGEELAIEVIKDFEEQGKEIVKQLGDSHKKEYDEFLAKLELGKEKIQEEQAKTMETVESVLAEGKGRRALVDVRANIGKGYSALDDAISLLMASLEGDLEGMMIL